MEIEATREFDPDDDELMPVTTKIVIDKLGFDPRDVEEKQEV